MPPGSILRFLLAAFLIIAPVGLLTEMFKSAFRSIFEEGKTLKIIINNLNRVLLGKRKKGMQLGRFIHRKEGAMKNILPSIVFLIVTLLIFMIGCEKKSEILHPIDEKFISLIEEKITAKNFIL